MTTHYYGDGCEPPHRTDWRTRMLDELGELIARLEVCVWDEEQARRELADAGVPPGHRGRAGEGGAVTSRLTFAAGSHAYYLADPVTGKKTRLPSVTTLLGQLAKPALVKWAARAAADYASDYWDTLAAMPPAERRKMIAAAPDQARNTAAAKGTAIHRWAEQLLAGEPVDIPEQHLGTVEQFARWWQGSGFTAAHSEMRLWSDEDDLAGCAYAGTCDLIATARDGRRWLLDFKTGSGIYGDYAVQLAAYAAAETWVIGGEDTRAGPIHRMGAIHIRPDATTLHTLDQEQRGIANQRWDILRSLRTVGEPNFTQEAS
jgi:hypothetical protein